MENSKSNIFTNCIDCIQNLTKTVENLVLETSLLKLKITSPSTRDNVSSPRKRYRLDDGITKPEPINNLLHSNLVQPMETLQSIARNSPLSIDLAMGQPKVNHNGNSDQVLQNILNQTLLQRTNM